TATPSAPYTTSAAASPSSVRRGSSATVTASVWSSQARAMLVDVEVYDTSWNKVCQQYFDNQAFTAGQTRTFTMNCAIPASAAPGTFTVMVGLFSPGWGTNLHWNGDAGRFTVIQ